MRFITLRGHVLGDGCFVDTDEARLKKRGEGQGGAGKGRIVVKKGGGERWRRGEGE